MDFLGLMFVTWVIVYFLHAVIGGLLAFFYRHFAKADEIKIHFK